MAWVEFHGAKIKRLKKFNDMKRELNWSTNEALGFLGSFWGEAIELSEDGDISKWSPEYLCELTGLTLNPERLWQTLVRTGWIDMTDDGLYLIHDWLDTAGRYLELRYRKSNPDRLTQIRALYDKPVISLAKAGPPYQPNQPNQTKPTKKRSSEKAAAIVAEPNVYYRFIKTFGELYTKETSQPFHKNGKHFALVKPLIDTHGIEAVVAKAQILSRYCQDGSAWFTKDSGFASFTIETLSSQWNSLIPQIKMSPEEISQKNILKLLNERRDKNARDNPEINSDTGS